jgi:hypothetical protein
MRRLAARAAAALCLAAAAGCNRSRDAAAGGPYADKVADAVPRIENATGLRFKRPPKVETRSQGEVRQFLERTFNESQGAKDLAAKAAVYKRLGLIPDTLDVRKLFVNLLTEQIVGFYDPKTKVLYVVNGAPREQVGVVVTHELVHALQDQYFNLDSLQSVEGDDDRVAAAQAVLEGQAVYEQINAMLGNDAASRIPGGWDRVRQMIREEQSSMPVFAGAPMVIQEGLIFPYLSGAEFMRRFKARRPGQVPFGDMPLSTEQILHEEAYLGAKRDAPLRVQLPPLAGGAAATYENDLGEFETRLFLFQHLRDQAGAVRGAAGWGGDRYALVTTPRGDGFVWVTVWDTPVDAAEFNDMLGQVVERRYAVRPAAGAASGGAPGSGAAPAATGTRSYAPAGRSVAITTGEVQGRPAVLYVDVPAGTSTSLLDISKVRVR